MPENKTPEKKNNKEKNIPGGSKTSRDEKTSKILGIASRIIIIGALAVFVLYQIFSGTGIGTKSPDADRNPPENPGTTTPEQSGTVQTPGPGGLDLTPDGQDPEPDTSDPGNLFDRTPWEYKLEDDGGEPAADSKGAQVESGTRYWIRDLSGNKLFKIVIPAAYTARDLGDCVMVSKGDMSVTGDDPLEFYWKYSAEIGSLLEYGGYDKLASSGTTGFDRYDIKAEGYYLFKDESGDEYPVVTALLSRVESDQDLDPYYEYWIVVGKPSTENKYLVGSVTLSGFAALKTGACPDITALAKAMFPMSSDPGMPDHWTYGQEPGTQDPQDQETLPAEPSGSEIQN